MLRVVYLKTAYFCYSGSLAQVFKTSAYQSALSSERQKWIHLEQQIFENDWSPLHWLSEQWHSVGMPTGFAIFVLEDRFPVAILSLAKAGRIGGSGWRVGLEFIQLFLRLFLVFGFRGPAPSLPGFRVLKHDFPLGIRPLAESWDRVLHKNILAFLRNLCNLA